jgi:hypothetical protein
MVNFKPKITPMHVRYLGYVALIAGLLAGCVGARGLTAEQRRDAVYLLGGANRYHQKWELVQVYDPYRGGQLIEAKPRQVEHLVFFQDGGFIQYTPQQYSRGQWKLGPERRSLALQYDKQADRPVPMAQRDTLYRYQLRLKEADSLILAIQGRHGHVELRYRAD